MRLQYMSDLHLERCNYEFNFPKKAPYLILGGDIGRLSDFEQYAGFIFSQCYRFEQVLLILGNHEFYGSSYEEGIEKASRLVVDSRAQQRLILLRRERGIWAIPGTNTIILGCTLYSHVSPSCTRLSLDFKRIKGWSVDKHNEEHRLDLEWLDRSIQNITGETPKKDIIVVSHFSPAFEKTSHPKYNNREGSECFSSDALEFIRNQNPTARVMYWIFGHTHWNTRFCQNKITLLSNQMQLDVVDLNRFERWKRAFRSKATLTII